MPKGFLANIQKMLRSMKMSNKWNGEKWSPNLIISEKGLKAEHSGPSGWICVRAVLPVPKLNSNSINKSIAFYYEVQILNKTHIERPNIAIGFCDRQFPLEGKKWLGLENNSIGIRNTKEIWIDGCRSKFENGSVAVGQFNKMDIVGVGIIHQPNRKKEYFATLNGKFSGKAKLPLKFAHLQLFPAVTLIGGNSIRSNFGKEEWTFKDFQRVLK